LLLYNWSSHLAKCDFSGDGLCDEIDLDLMQGIGPIAPGVPATGNEQFDLDGNGTIDLADRDQWLADAATQNGFGSPYKLGDANIDGTVDGQDFIAWNAAKFTSALLCSDGNFSGDICVDGQDFILWNANKFTSSDGVSAVPEPATAMFSLLGVAALGFIRRR
jgi:MYXO-CTERM domain-containing protein